METDASDASDASDARRWAVRAFVYAYTSTNAHLPTVAETATTLGIAPDEALAAYQWLHRRHALFLDADGRSIRMAHPFSGVPTDFRVFANGHAYWANCAWDMLGIPAALHTDARIEARYADTHDPTSLVVAGGAVRGDGEVVYFALPFARWYVDLVFT